jgi:ligand-binding sensor domain-containing protein
MKITYTTALKKKVLSALAWKIFFHRSRVCQAVIFLALLWLPHFLVAQPTRLPPGFDLITTEEGLSQGYIGAILQDRRGFLWFGTRDGLNRYDGYHFKVFRTNPFDSTTISGNWVSALCEDHLGNLWVGTSTGLNFFDPQTETFVRIPSAPKHANGLYDEDVHTIVAAQAAPTDSTLVLWIGTGKALNRLVLPVPIDPERLVDALRLNLAKDMTHFLLPVDDDAAVKSLPIGELLLDRTNQLWIAKRGDLYRAPARSTGSLQFQRMTERMRDITTARTVRFTQDKHGIVWLATGAGLMRIEPSDTSLQSVRYYKITWTVQQLAAYPKDEFSPRALIMDKKGRIWITYGVGFYIFHPETESFENLTTKLASSIEQPERYGWQMIETANGVIWTGSSGFGLLKYDLKKERFHTLTRANVIPGMSNTLYVRSFEQTPEGEVLVNQQLRVDQKREVIIPYREAPVKDAQTMLRAPGGEAWMATSHELYHLPPGQHQPRKIFSDPTKDFQLFIMANNDLWFINGMWEFDFVNNDFHLHHYQRISGSIESDSITFPAEASDIFGIKSGVLDSQGRFWLAAQNGLLRIEPASGKIKVYRSDPRNPHSLNQNFVKSVLVDPILPERYLWIGTEGGGLNRLDMANESFVHYLEEDGLPNRTVYGVLADDDGNLWLSTNRGISKAILDRQSRELVRFRNYHARDGLQGDEFNTNAWLKNEKGEFFLVASMG